MSFLLENSIFTTLSEGIISGAKDFSCGHPDLDVFFITIVLHTINHYLISGIRNRLNNEQTIVCKVPNDSLQTIVV